MPEFDSYEPGCFNWVDVTCPDPAAAATFYTGLFGWDAEVGGPESGGYGMFSIDGKIVAGLGPTMQEGAPPCWTTYISVTDVDATTAAVTANGGTVLAGPMDVFDAGRMAVCADPAGSVFALWQPGQTAGVQLANEPNTWIWNELGTRDRQASTAFYGAVLPWTFETMPMADGNEYTVVQVGGRGVGGVFVVEEGMRDGWAVYFDVADCDASAAKVAELGGTVDAPPFDVPDVGRISMVTDPQGASFGIMTPVPVSPG